MAAQPIAEQLTTSFDQPFTESTVRREEGRIENLAIGGLKSLNGYTYRAEAYQTAIAQGVYERVPVYVDHAANPNAPRKRSVRDLVGYLENAHWDARGNKPRATLQVTNKRNEWVLDLAQANQPNVGMSQVVYTEGLTKDSKEVASIKEAVSVDIVCFPATTRCFTEQHNPDTEGVYATLSGSWEEFECSLRSQVKDFLCDAKLASCDSCVFLMAVFQDTVVVRVSSCDEAADYQIAWKMDENNEPVLDGEPVEVEIKATVVPAGTEAAGEQPTGQPVTTEQTTMSSEPKTVEPVKSAAEQRIVDQCDALTEANEQLEAKVEQLEAKVAKCDADLAAERAAHAETKKVADKWLAHEQLTQKTAKANGRIEAAKLPDAMVTEVFMESLVACADESAMDKLIADRKALAEKIPSKTSSRPTSESRTPSAPATSDEPTEQPVSEQAKRDLVSAICG